MKKFWDNYHFVFLAVGFWRIILSMFEVISIRIPIFSQTYVGNSPWSNTDGINYVRIAQWGYGAQNEAFFPVYPFLIRGIHSIIPLSFETIGICISLISVFVGLCLLYAKLVKTSISKARWIIVFVLSFPTAFFFTAVYTEALFFLLVALIFHFSSQKKWFIASLCVAVASGTRIVGICTAIIVMYELWKEKQLFKLQTVPYILIMPLGLLFYSLYLLCQYNDPLRFMHIQATYEINRTGGTFVMLPQVFWRYIKIITSTIRTIHPLTYAVAFGELVLTIGALYLIYYGWRKRMNIGYLLYSFIVLLIPTLTGTLMSMPRYLLTIVPLFIVLTYIKNNWIKYALVGIFSVLQMFAVTYFLRGWFIA